MLWRLRLTWTDEIGALLAGYDCCGSAYDCCRKDDSRAYYRKHQPVNASVNPINVGFQHGALILSSVKASIDIVKAQSDVFAQWHSQVIVLRVINRCQGRLLIRSVKFAFDAIVHTAPIIADIPCIGGGDKLDNTK